MGNKINQKSYFYKIFEPKIKEILHYYKKINGDLKPPIDPFIIANICKCRVEAAPRTVSYEGLLIPIRNGFVIRYRENLWRHRRRLTICHEVAHTFFYDTSSLIPKKIIKHLKEEDFCFEAGRKFLVPEAPLRRAFNNEWSWENIFASLKRFADLFECSLEVIANRLTTDTSLLRNEMITFWRYKNTRDVDKNINPTRHPNFSYEDFKKESYLSQKLARFFPRYQRFTHIYKKSWPLLEEFLETSKIANPWVYLEWKRKVERRMKYVRIPVYVEVEHWTGTSEESGLNNNRHSSKFYGVVSIIRKTSQN